MYHTGTHYTVTTDAITPTGRREHYPNTDRETAIARCLYTHQVHNGNATVTAHGVILCPACGQIAITRNRQFEELEG